MQISKYFFDSIGRDSLKSHPKGTDWPVVYLISNDDYLYIGETTSASQRMKQHMDNKKKKKYGFNELKEYISF